MDKNRRKLIHYFCGLFRVREKTTGHLVKYIYDTEKQRGNMWIIQDQSNIDTTLHDARSE